MGALQANCIYGMCIAFKFVPGILVFVNYKFNSVCQNHLRLDVERRAGKDNEIDCENKRALAYISRGSFLPIASNKAYQRAMGIYFALNSLRGNCRRNSFEEMGFEKLATGQCCISL